MTGFFVGAALAVAVFECLNHINTSDRTAASGFFFFFSLSACLDNVRQIISEQKRKLL